LAVYYLFYFMQTIGYVSAGPIPNQVLISHWFSRLRGIAMGTAYLGIGVGGAAAPVLAQFIIRHWGWRIAMFSIGGIIVLFLIPITLVVIKNRPADMGLQPDGSLEPVTDSKPGGEEFRLRRALHTPDFWLILIGSLMSIGAVGGVIQHLQLHLRDQRFTPEHAAQIASLLLISSIAGRLMMGYLADRCAKKYVMLAAFMMVAGAIPFLYTVQTPGAVHLFAIIFGFGMGADYMLIPLMTAECFGVASLGRLMGVILTTDALSQALTPVLVGRIYDIHKSYNSGFALLIGMAAMGAIAVMFISKQRRIER
jgi:sugar phosphate permease